MQSMVGTTLELARVLERLDQPLAALEVYTSASEAHPGALPAIIGGARLQETLGDGEASLEAYKTVGGLYKVQTDSPDSFSLCECRDISKDCRMHWMWRGVIGGL